MRMKFSYKAYPQSKELTEKSRRIGLLTHPIIALAIGALPGLLCAVLIPTSVQLPMILMLLGMIAGPILFARLRKKKYAQYDAEYAKLLQNSK